MFDGEFVNAGAILVRQRGTRIHPGENVGKGSDDTLFATSPGTVKYGTRANRRLVSVLPEEIATGRVRRPGSCQPPCRQRRCGGCLVCQGEGKAQGQADGGNGGPGGSVYLRADPSVATLIRYQRNPHYSAGHGTHGQGDLRHGKSGEGLILPVPLGTVVIDDEGTMVADLVEEGQEIEAVKGGRGGEMPHSSTPPTGHLASPSRGSTDVRSGSPSS